MVVAGIALAVLATAMWVRALLGAAVLGAAWLAGRQAGLQRRLDEAENRLTRQAVLARRAALRSERFQQFTSLLLDHVNTGAMARAIVADGRRVVDAESAAIALLKGEGMLDILAVEGVQTEPDTGPLMDVVAGREPVWQPSTQGAARALLPLMVEDRVIGVLLLTFASGEIEAADRAFLQLLAQECAQALERARLYEMELRARVRAEFAERRLAFLSEASAQLVASLDYLTTLANLAEFSVPEIADWCVIHLIDEDGMPRAVAIAHSDPETAAVRRSLELRYPSSLDSDAPFARVIRTGKPVHIEEVGEQHLRAIARDDEHLAVLRSLGLRAQISVPISINERVGGVFTLATAESGRRFTDSDVRLASELARRAGHAVENARLYQVAHHASEAKSDFLAVMSHELRTPLNAIIGYSDLLLLGVPDTIPERAQRQIERIRSASTSLLHLVEEVLSFSRIEAGKEDVRISPVDVSQVVKDCAAMIEPLAQEKGLDVIVSVPDSAVKLISDEHKLRQILTNLLSNAVKFTESGSIEAAVTASATDACVAIRDTGIGIAPEYLERIFDPFWQVEQSATRRFGGTGLGLGVARKLARLLEGRLEVQSEVGKGSTFTLVLPLRLSMKPRNG